jgi:hypothetical protein
MTAKGIGKKGFTRTVGAEHGPVFAVVDLPGSIFENQAVTEAKGGVFESQKWPP